MVKAIAIGNRLMMDDGIALAVLENIKNKLEFIGIEIIIGETDFQFCFHQLKAEDFVVILDATYTGTEPGSIYSYKLQEIITESVATNFQHDISVFDLMKLYSNSPRGYLIGIEVDKVAFGWELSETLKCKFNDICNDIEKIIFEIVKEA